MAALTSSHGRQGLYDPVEINVNDVSFHDGDDGSGSFTIVLRRSASDATRLIFNADLIAQQ